MATVIARRPTRPRRLGLASQMGRVLKAFQRVGTSLDAEAVHRLRVALRRCRSLAVLMEEVDPHPAWTELKRLSHRLFKTLGALRDTQVLENWVKKLTPADDALRTALIAVLEDREVEPRARVRGAIRRFDRQAWKRLAHPLDRRARVVPPNGLAAQCLALERYHRGTEPTPRHGRFARLRTARQALVRGLAGVLRVARALDHCGATIPPRVRAEEAVGGVRLRVPGLIDTRAHAARLAAATPLLETYLRPLLLIGSTGDVASQPATRLVARRIRRPRTGDHL